MNFDYYYGIEAEQFSFYRIPRSLIKDEKFKKLSSDAKILYGLMLDRMALSMRNGWVDEYNRVYIYYSIDDIMEDLGCSKPTCVKILNELDSKKGIGLIEKKRQGQGKPDCIYVKNFVIDENGENTLVSEVKNINLQKLNNFTSKSKEIEPQEVKNFNPNYTNINKTDISYNNPINQSEKEKEIDMIEEYKNLIAENIEYDYWMQYGNVCDREVVENLYQTICDVVCVQREKIRIGGTLYPYELVKAQFLKIKHSHINYVLRSLKANTAKIKNIKAYLLTTLYNAPSSMNCYYQQEVQHDLCKDDD